MRRRYLPCAVAVLLTLVTITLPALAAEPTKDSLDVVKKNLAEGKAVLVDVRELPEWKAGHLADAILIPLSQLRKHGGEQGFAAQLAKKLSRKKIVYAHCRSGHRCLLAADDLKRLGYDVRPLKAGYQKLLEAGFAKAKAKAEGKANDSAAGK